MKELEGLVIWVFLMAVSNHCISLQLLTKYSFLMFYASHWLFRDDTLVQDENRMTL